MCTRVCVRVWLGGTTREPGLAASVFTHNRRFPAARKLMHSLALREDCEAKFNLYEGCYPTESILHEFSVLLKGSQGQLCPSLHLP